jgi:3-oxoacyl-[acyl-carrier protein] reductase
MNLGLTNKIVLVTGGTGGIGKQICLDFLLEGAVVICLHRNENRFKNLVDRIALHPGLKNNLHGKLCDLLSVKALQQQITKITTEFKRIDVLVNCAGVVEEIPFAITDEKHMDKMIDDNLKITMLVTQSVLKPMFSQKGGAIVNVSSVVAVKGGRGIVAYASAKGGIEAFSRALAYETGRKNIRINTVKPGAIETEMSKTLQNRASDYVLGHTVLGRFGKPEEVSKAVLFLSSDETASFITGSGITVDGGFLL